MTHASGRAGFAEQMAAIAIAIIGHDPRHRHAEAGEPGERAPQEGNRALLVLVGQDLGVGEARGIVDTDMQVIPADAAMAVDGAGAAAGDAMTDALDSAELLGVDVQQLAWVLALISNDHGRRIEGFQALRPSRRSTAVTVEIGMASCRAIAGELIRWRRNRSISATRSGGVRRWWMGVELPSLRLRSPPARQRFSHFPTVLTLTPNAAATRCRGCFSSTMRRTMRSRLRGVVRAFLWMFIRGSGSGC